MRTEISLDTILQMLRPLSRSNKKWIADRLYEDVATTTSATSNEKVTTTSKYDHLRGIAKGITPEQIEEDSRLAYILKK